MLKKAGIPKRRLIEFIHKNLEINTTITRIGIEIFLSDTLFVEPKTTSSDWVIYCSVIDS